MQITLIGYGTMGQLIKKLALARGHNITTIDPQHSEADFKNILEADLTATEMLIDFSSASVVQQNVETAVKNNLPIVIGTTGWNAELEQITKIANDGKIGLLWSSNFSIGVNLYYKIIAEAAKLINNFSNYDVWGTEIHHVGKADSPSGTAKQLEKILLANITRKTTIMEDKLDRKIRPEEIHFSSTRGGLVNFGHTIGFDSPTDAITITHMARNREGYALGAIQSAEWLQGKIGVFSMEDFLNN